MRFSLLFLAVIALGFMEVIGIASVLPFMELLSKENAIEQSSFLQRFYDFFSFQTQKDFIVWSGLFVIIIIALTNFLAIATNYYYLKLSWGMSHKISVRLLQTYIKKPYNYYIVNNTADLRAYLLTEAAVVTSGVIIPGIEFISRSIVCLVIFSLLLFINIEITLLTILFLGGIYGIIYLSRQRFLKDLGADRIDINKDRYKYLDELMNGIKTIKLYGVEKAFHDRFWRASQRFSEVQPKVQMIYATPRYLLEILAFGGILSVTLYLYIYEGDLSKSLPRLTLFAVAGYRLLPALQKAFSSISKVRHNLPSLDRLFSDIIENKGESDAFKKELAPFNFEKTISIDKLHFRYENAKDLLIEDLSLSIDKGSTVAFVGSTGSGKTTVIDLLTGLLSPTQGSITIDQVLLTQANVKSWQHMIAYVPQEVFLYDDTVKNNIAIGIADEEINDESIEDAIRIAGVQKFIMHELPDQLDTKIGERGIRLSGGQRQRLGLARALYRKPKVLVLDEATSALDTITEQGIVDSLKDLPKELTTIIITHRMSTVKYADHIFFLDKGEIIAEGQFEQLKNINQKFRQMTASL